MKKTALLIIIFFMFSFAYAETWQEEYNNDYIYSEEYFDYLIELAKQNNKKDTKEEKTDEKITNDSFEEEIIISDVSPFKLHIEENLNIPLYKKSFIKEGPKTTIPISDNFFVVQDILKTRNKYNSDDYKVQTGIEYKIKKPVIISGGIETNFRGLDQNPASRKLYFTPVFKIGDKLSLKFHNKLNIFDYSQDHDLGLNLSPFKSKVLDFGMYSGMTRKRDGSVSESINFSTNFYF